MTLMVSFELQSESNIVVNTQAGISVLPAVTDPKPGDRAEGMRILSHNLSGNQYIVELEGKSGSSGMVEIWSGGQDLNQAENARFIDKAGRIFRFNVDFEKSEKKYVTKTISINMK
jgi:hypothetical protein